jgi:hypothetical protein
MNAGRARRWLFRSLPGILLVATFVDDPVFGSVIVASRLAFGTTGLLVASVGFVAISIAMAAATAWALHHEPLRLSPKNERRIAGLHERRFGRYLVPHPERPITTAIAAIIFGSVAPIVVAALEPGPRTVSMTKKMTLISGIAYGLAFALGYGLLGAIVGAVT